MWAAFTLQKRRLRHQVEQNSCLAQTSNPSSLTLHLGYVSPGTRELQGGLTSDNFIFIPTPSSILSCYPGLPVFTQFLPRWLASLFLFPFAASGCNSQRPPRLSLGQDLEDLSLTPRWLFILLALLSRGHPCGLLLCCRTAAPRGQGSRSSHGAWTSTTPEVSSYL